MDKKDSKNTAGYYRISVSCLACHMSNNIIVWINKTSEDNEVVPRYCVFCGWAYPAWKLWPFYMRREKADWFNKYVNNWRDEMIWTRSPKEKGYYWRRTKWGITGIVFYFPYNNKLKGIGDLESFAFVPQETVLFQGPILIENLPTEDDYKAIN